MEHPCIIRITQGSIRVNLSALFSRLHLTSRVDGVLGPIIIHGPNTAHYDIDLGPVLLTDAYHEQYYDLIKTVMTPLDKGGYPEPPSDNNLINGKMTFNCSTVAAGDTTPCNSEAGISKFVLTTGKTHLLRLINAGSEGLQRFSIDGHELTIIANDFVPVVSLPSIASVANNLIACRNRTRPR